LNSQNAGITQQVSEFTCAFWVASSSCVSGKPDWQVEALCSQVVRSFVRLFVHPFVRLSVTNLWTGYFENESTDSDANWYKWSTAPAHKMVDVGGQEVKRYEDRSGGMAETSFLYS